MTAMEYECRCAHPDHKAGTCGGPQRVTCPTCGTKLCLDCAASHHKGNHSPGSPRTT